MNLSNALKAEIASYDDAEWTGTLGGQSVTLSARPLTSADITVISRKHPTFTQAPSLEGMVDLLIMKAQSPDGSQAFSKADKPLMMRLSTDKIGEIFGELFGSQMDEYGEEEHEEAVKN